MTTRTWPRSAQSNTTGAFTRSRVTALQSSVLPLSTSAALSAYSPVTPSSDTEIFWHTATGSSSSRTVTSVVQVSVWPRKSTTVRVMVCGTSTTAQS